MRGAVEERVLVSAGCRLFNMIHERKPIATKELASHAEPSVLGSLIVKLVEIRRSLIIYEELASVATDCHSDPLHQIIGL